MTLPVSTDTGAAHSSQSFSIEASGVSSLSTANTLNEPDRSDNEFPLYLSLNQLKDADGIGNAWKQLHFGPLDRDGRDDLDGDGLNEVFEFLKLNDPLDESSTPLSQ